MTPGKPLELAAALTETFESGRFEACNDLLAGDCVLERNYERGRPPARTREATIAELARIRAGMLDCSVRDVSRIPTPDGFLQMHQLRCTVRDGVSLHVDVAIMADVRDGRITSLREYADGLHLRPLLRGLP